MFGGAGGNEIVTHVFDFMNAPSMLVLSFAPAFVWGLFHFSYWALLGGLASFGFATLRAKITGDD
jgi:hypothetical protein